MLSFQRTLMLRYEHTILYEEHGQRTRELSKIIMLNMEIGVKSLVLLQLVSIKNVLPETNYSFRAFKFTKSSPIFSIDGRKWLFRRIEFNFCTKFLSVSNFII